jgi:hypothetical protein
MRLLGLTSCDTTLMKKLQIFSRRSKIVQIHALMKKKHRCLCKRQILHHLGAKKPMFRFLLSQLRVLKSSKVPYFDMRPELLNRIDSQEFHRNCFGFPSPCSPVLVISWYLESRFLTCLIHALLRRVQFIASLSRMLCIWGVWLLLPAAEATNCADKPVTSGNDADCNFTGRQSGANQGVTFTPMQILGYLGRQRSRLIQSGLRVTGSTITADDTEWIRWCYCAQRRSRSRSRVQRFYCASPQLQLYSMRIRGNPSGTKVRGGALGVTAGTTTCTGCRFTANACGGLLPG